MSLLSNNSTSPSNGMPSTLNGGDVLPTQSIVAPVHHANNRADEIAVISHELRNSLGVLRNAARLLRLQFGVDGIARARILIERQVGHMNRHIGTLLEISQGGARKQNLRLSYLDLRTVLAESIEAIAPDLARRGHHLVVSLPADALWVHADGARLDEVFSNLLINAGKYTPDGGEITLTMERIENQASIRVRDSGIGIAPAQLSRIFDMYAQVDATADGSGIGLAVVRDLVEMHGGAVGVTSAGLGFGSEFIVILPALCARPDEALPATIAPAP
jgi:signal transduction histidine kinase